MSERHRKLVVGELLTKPSAVSPMLFVGLGGCGCRMVARIARHLRSRQDFEERYRSLVKFALVDTNVNDLEGYREIADETFLLSDFEKEEYANLASGKLFLEADPYFTQWVPPNYRFRAGDTSGAGQIRLESRLGLFYQMKHKDLVPRFHRLLEDLKGHQHGHRRLDSAEIRIVVCYSVAGGTGSGCHLPIAYMLRDHAREVGKPWMIGVAVLPAVFEEKTGANRDGTFANGYAALKETEHLMKLGAPDSRFYPDDGLDFHYDPSEESKKAVRERPFEFLYVIDKPESFSVAEPIDAAADGLYLQFFSPLFGAQAGDYDNYTQHQRFLVPHDFEHKGIQGFSTFYGSYGAAVLLVPVPGLVDYCAQSAALSLMRASFLGSIPGDPLYARLRTAPEPFFEVTLSDDRDARPVPVGEFVKRPREERNRLLDRLFQKRVRLLAACEADQNVDQRFLSLFRHGHRVGERPNAYGGVELKGEAEAKRDRDFLEDKGMEFSIGALVLPAIAGARPGEPIGLLQAAEQRIRSWAEENRMSPADGLRAMDLRNRAAGWVDDFRREGMRILNEGYKDGRLRFPGLNSLVELRFLTDEAGAVDLAAKRYAVLCLREQMPRTPTLPPSEELQVSGYEGARETKVIKDKGEQQSIIEDLERQAIDRTLLGLQHYFYERIQDLDDRLKSFVETQRTLDQGFDDLEREHLHRLERLSKEGDSSTNQYVLDAEALQIEDGRRLWDFYYEDRVADLPELTLTHPRVQQVLSEAVTHLSLTRGGASTSTLHQLFTALYQYARDLLQVHIGGDPHSPDRQRRDGLTLVEALELEVVYRALYRSNVPEIARDSHKAIRQIVHEYRNLPNEMKVDLSDPLHRDYLRDKIRRVVKEKASLLCLYDDSRDQQGGVRPDEIFLAAIGDVFRGTRIEEAIRGADLPKLHWVTEGWHSPKEIIFYRAILNVPLYVFGRMDKMKNSYEAFKKMAKRSKALHIDKNWEEGLADLDPVSAQEKHRQKLVRNQIINFAALLTITRSDGKGPGFIVRRDGRYWLCDPAHLGNGGGSGERGLTLLGSSMAESIERLPEVLQAEKVKFLPYQHMLQAVRDGLSPKVLRGIAVLPVQWRRYAEDLRTLYGSNPSADELERLRDYEDSYRRLHESLEDLLERLRNKEIEQMSLDGESSEETKKLGQSVAILRTFSESWRQLESPGPNRHGSAFLDFQGLFDSLAPNQLDEEIKKLKAVFNPPLRREPPTLPVTPPVTPPEAGEALPATPSAQEEPGDSGQAAQAGS